MEKRRYIFIVGSGRCGTTALARILGHHPEISFLPELKFFSHALAGRKGYRPLTSPQRIRRFFSRRALPKVLKFNPPLRHREEEILRTFDRKIARAEAAGKSENEIYRFIFDFLIDCFREKPARHVILQTPANLYFTDTIEQILGPVPIIGMIRDPRNFFASAMKGNLQWARKADSIIALWNISAAYLEKIRTSKVDRFILIRQEDLLSDPAEALQRLSSFLSLPLENLAGKVETGIHTAFSPSDPGDPRHRYVHLLSPGEIARVETFASPAAARFGYPCRTTPRVPLLKKIGWRLSYRLRFVTTHLDIYWRKKGRVEAYLSLKKMPPLPPAGARDRNK